MVNVAWCTPSIPCDHWHQCIQLSRSGLQRSQESDEHVEIQVEYVFAGCRRSPNLGLWNMIYAIMLVSSQDSELSTQQVVKIFKIGHHLQVSQLRLSKYEILAIFKKLGVSQGNFCIESLTGDEIIHLVINAQALKTDCSYRQLPMV